MKSDLSAYNQLP
jgi:hypothetical protein